MGVVGGICGVLVSGEYNFRGGIENRNQSKANGRGEKEGKGQRKLTITHPQHPQPLPLHPQSMRTQRTPLGPEKIRPYVLLPHQPHVCVVAVHAATGFGEPEDVYLFIGGEVRGGEAFEEVAVEAFGAEG